MKVLLEQAATDNVDTILTGHHQDDQYETVLLRLARGSSIIGLGGIPSFRDCFFRPQLDYSKAHTPRPRPPSALLSLLCRILMVIG